MAINYAYLSFLLKKIELFSFLQYVIFIGLFFFIITLLYSIILILIIYRIERSVKLNLIKHEKLLKKLKKSYDNGQINAKQYKSRITNINNKYFS